MVALSNSASEYRVLFMRRQRFKSSGRAVLNGGGVTSSKLSTRDRSDISRVY